MADPPFLNLALNVEKYREYFETTYCRGPLTTFDGIEVRFQRKDFDHCCFNSTRRNKDKDSFDIFRARRLGWIRETLQSSNAQLRVGWDKAKKRYDHKRRVAVIYEDYVVVIAITSPKKARFITAYKVEEYSTIEKILSGPIWTP